MNLIGTFENSIPFEEENSFSDYSIINNNQHNIILLDEFYNINTCYPFSMSIGLDHYEILNTKFDIIKKSAAKHRKEKEDNIKKKLKHISIKS